ncbi:hypothetical protein TYRP_015143 [Tyrophagus putrescentiae]|nr:hypothetical protein TYRP_015143 [Tyrophagus putrescentiae]
MVIFRAEKGLLKQVIHRSSLSLCSGSSEDIKCRPMSAAADNRHQYRVQPKYKTVRIERQFEQT